MLSTQIDREKKDSEGLLSPAKGKEERRTKERKNEMEETNSTFESRKKKEKKIEMKERERKKKKPGAGSSEGFAAPREEKRDGFEIPMGAEATTK